MRTVLSLLFGGALLLAGLSQPARAQSQPGAGPGLYTVTYFSVGPASTRKATAILRQFSAAGRKEDGNAELIVLREIGRPGHFAILEAWRDKPAYDAHGAAAKTLGDKLQPLFASPFETRQFVPLALGPAPAGNLENAVFVLTHVDVFPAGKDEVAGLVKTEAEDSRKDPGALRYDAVIWDGHANHFHLIAAWTDRKALAAHGVTGHTAQFRAKVAPFEGAFYDERLFEVVKGSE